MNKSEIASSTTEVNTFGYLVIVFIIMETMLTLTFFIEMVSKMVKGSDYSFNMGIIVFLVAMMILQIIAYQVGSFIVDRLDRLIKLEEKNSTNEQPIELPTR